MTGAATATVETLTAEVRVLMVGNRQVTLSVAKQLDVIPIVDIRPFGRIAMKDGPDIIGSDADGVLCASYARPSLREMAWGLNEEDLKPGLQLPLICHQTQREDRDHQLLLIFEGHPVRFMNDEVDDRHAAAVSDRRYCSGLTCRDTGWCSEHEHCSDACKFWDPRDYRDQIRRNVLKHRALWTAEAEAIAEAKAMPLIVLAGLR